MLPRTCTLCGCTDDRPCLGGVVYSSTWAGAWATRLVTDPDLLALGEPCHWAAETDQGWVCSAHTAEEVERILGITAGSGEAAWGSA